MTSFLFWFSMLMSIILAFLGMARHSSRMIFGAALLSWFLSSLAAWSIGWIILALPFVFGALGVTTFFRWDSVLHRVIAVGAGIILWGIVISWFSEYLILFWPWLWLLWR